MKNSPLSDIQIGVVTHQWAEAHSISCDYHKTTTSTNALAKEDAFNGLDPIQLYVADEQTNGRGRHDHTWSTPSTGSSLLSSWSFHVQKPPTPYITATIGICLYNAVKATWPFLNWNLKAPNDLYINEFKIAGLLTETISQGNQIRLIIGLGLNVFDHPKQIKNSTDLFSELQKLKPNDPKLDHFPLLGEDWIKFLDRFLFEICAAIPESHQEPDFTSKQTMLYLFNQHALLKIKYTDFNSLKEDLWR